MQTKVQYPNNKKLKNQKIILSKDLKIKEVSVFDQDGVEVMKMTYDSIQYSPKFDKDNFKIDSILSNDSNEAIQESSSLEDVIYPLFVPSGTKLVEEEEIPKENGKRIIMNYDGEKSFLLVEETADVFHEFTVLPTLGEPYLFMDSLGVMNDNSFSWTSGGVDFYLVSDVMSTDEMMEVAQSISGIVSMK